MARGTAANEPIISQAANDAFREGHSRTFGDKPVQRGRWVWDEAQRKLVQAEDYHAPERALDAPIIADRIHEGAFWDDGTRKRDLGSRRRRREFLKETGWCDHSDFKEYRQQYPAQREREIAKSLDGAMEKAKRKLYQQGKWR